MASPLRDDPRVALARRDLEASRQAEFGADEPARWWGRLEASLAYLLDIIDQHNCGGGV